MSMNELLEPRKKPSVLDKLVLCDAGRSVPGERSDCTVRALAIAFGVEYKEAHAVMELAGRKRGKGSYLANAFSLGLTTHLGTVVFESLKPRRKLYKLLEELPTGRYILGFRGHVCAVVNGQIWDQWVPPAGKFVNRLWKITPSPDRPARCVREGRGRAVQVCKIPPTFEEVEPKIV